ncbi:hypothetical protein Cgig2_001337 [Carnegiea gigantea]|uniref:DUF6598 domain-containing protein n=1 Tax=Carnegiea gigantea TaxID=171969 RepID=A0A9Q1KRS9_9CARY|nr:hypothetical protein Cgig2_001337 [Carnegiea gigantea]
MTPEMETAASKPDLYEDILAAPLVQVFSVWIHSNFVDGRPCEIYGSICATEGPSTSFLYRREADESETIQELGKLSLIGPGLKIYTYDKLRMVVVQTENNFAYLYYVAFQFAVSAVVEAAIIERADDARSCFANVYGSLVASYSDNRRFCKSDDELKYLQTALFEKSSDKPLRMVVGTPIILSTSVVAVPAYSSLVIEVNLFDSQVQLASGRMEFPARSFGERTELIQSENGSVQVKVTWRNAYRCMYEERESKSGNAKDSKNGETEPSKKGRVLEENL